MAGDAERLARFQREAEVLASLNHPNIAAIYGLEDTDGIKGLVMELVEGPTLADVIAGSGLLAMGSGQNSGLSAGPGPRAQSRRGLPIDEALPIARAVPIASDGTTFEPGTSVALFEPRPRMVGGGTNLDLGTQYDVARDARFLVNTDIEEATVPITLIQNWSPAGR